MGKEERDRNFQHDIRVGLCGIISKLERTNELLEMIKDQNEGAAQLIQELDEEDIPDGLKEVLKARKALVGR